MSKTVKKTEAKNAKKVKGGGIDFFFDVFERHPFIFTAVFCLLLFPLGFAQAEQITGAMVFIEAAIWILGISALFAFCPPSQKRAVNIYLIVSSALTVLIFSLTVGFSEKYSVLMFLPALFILIQLAVVMKSEGSLTADRAVLMMIVLGVVVRYCYCLTNDCGEMQHDVGNFTGTGGHESYIAYWFNKGLVLPDFDVTKHWQYYHPPLHHILMAVAMRVLTVLGMPLKTAQEAIQILPMIYSALSMVVCRRIFRLVKLEGAGLVTAMALVCFYPTFILWSGAYNNDMLAALFMLLAIMQTIKWYQKPSFKTIIPIAVFVGCGMMTKLSAWMVAPGIALVFLWVFIRNIKKPLPLIGQFAAFGGVCVPLGLWWGIRNLIAFDIPITYVPDTKMSVMSVENIPALQRLFDFSLFQFDYSFEAFTMYGAPYNEYNPLIGLLKTSLFDEFNKGWDFAEMATAFVIIAGLLALVSFGCLIYMTFKKGICGDQPVKLLFAVTFLTIIISYTAFCFEFPYVCTENIRYCMPVIPILAMALGFGVNAAKKAIGGKAERT